MGRTFTAELLGTFLLVFGGAGAAVIAGPAIGLLGVALAFGLSLMAGAYVFGPVSGGHFNPAVTLAQATAGVFSWKKVIPYIIAQILGGILGAGALYALMMTQPGFDVALGFASNGFGVLSPGQFSFMAVAITEVIVTFFFVSVILGTTRKDFPGAMGGVVVGMTLATMILVSGVVSNASLNPARSLATAVFEGGMALEQVWLFFVAPTVGALLAAVSHRCMTKTCSSCSTGTCAPKEA